MPAVKPVGYRNVNLVPALVSGLVATQEENGLPERVKGIKDSEQIPYVTV